MEGSNGTNVEKNKLCNIYERYQRSKASGGFSGIRQNIIFSLFGFVVSALNLVN